MAYDTTEAVAKFLSALADDALTLRKYSTDEFVDKLYAQGVKPSAALSRFTLPENRKAALNLIRKLNESRDSNDNAL